MSTKILHEFVGQSLAKGQSRDEIAAVLKEGGWDTGDIRKALAAYHDCDFPVPVPSKRYSLAARDTVFYLFLFTALYLATLGVIFLAFNILDLILPQASDHQNIDHIESRIRYWIAWTIVFAPVYLTAAWKAEARTREDPARLMSSAQQWLTYITLFVAGMTALGDLVALFYGFLSGDVTLRFILKVAVIGTVSGAVLAYYFRSIRKVEDREQTGAG